MKQLEEQASQVDKIRLLAVKAPHAGAWLGAAPSRGMDLLMTNEEIRSRVGRRLGASIGDEGACMFCMQSNDEFGIHPESCMGGGDKVTAHNTCRNTIHGHAKAAGARPQLEKAASWQGGGYRAAKAGGPQTHYCAQLKEYKQEGVGKGRA